MLKLDVIPLPDCEIIEGRYYFIKPALANNKCLDIEGDSGENGAPVIQYTCHNGENQQFSFKKFRNQYYEDDSYIIIVKSSGKVFTLDWGSIVQSTEKEKGTGNQRFIAKKFGVGCIFINICSDNCFDISGASLEDLTPLIDFGCHDGLNQQFNLELIE